MDNEKFGVMVLGVSCPTKASLDTGVSRATLRRWGKADILTPCYIGGKLFFLDSELQARKKSRK